MASQTKRERRESDLAFPVKNFLVGQGYTVRSEVKDCDITAVQGDELLIVELKRGFTVDLLIQAVERQRVADAVYVAIPFTGERRTRCSRRWLGMERVLKRLALGLILVHFRPHAEEATGVEVVFHPIQDEARGKRPRQRQAILREIAGRSDDYNVGGSSGSPLLTAYREEAIYLALSLERSGPQAPAQLRANGGSSRAQSILHRNVYGWFERLDRGVYGVRPAVADYITETWPVFALRCREQVACRADGLQRTEDRLSDI